MQFNFSAFVAGWLLMETYFQFKNNDIKGGISCLLGTIALGITLFK